LNCESGRYPVFGAVVQAITSGQARPDFRLPQPKSITRGSTTMRFPITCDIPATCCTKYSGENPIGPASVSIWEYVCVHAPGQSPARPTPGIGGLYEPPLFRGLRVLPCKPPWMPGSTGPALTCTQGQLFCVAAFANCSMNQLLLLLTSM